MSKDTVSMITDRVLEGMAAWQSRPLEEVYSVVFIDALRVKVRDGQVANRPIYLALGVAVDGQPDFLGLWAGERGEGEGAKYWLRVLTEIKSRGVMDVLMLVCDGLKGLHDSVAATWPQTVVQRCVVHLLRNSFAYAGRQHWSQIARGSQARLYRSDRGGGIRPFAEFCEKWDHKYPAIVRLWTNAWAEFVPFLAFDVEIRKVVCTTNAIESGQRPATSGRERPRPLPDRTSRDECLYMALMGLDPTGQDRGAWVRRWKPALNAFDIHFDGRLTAARH